MWYIFFWFVIDEIVSKWIPFLFLDNDLLHVVILEYKGRVRLVKTWRHLKRICQSDQEVIRVYITPEQLRFDWPTNLLEIMKFFGRVIESPMGCMEVDNKYIQGKNYFFDFVEYISDEDIEDSSM